MLHQHHETGSMVWLAQHLAAAAACSGDDPRPRAAPAGGRPPASPQPVGSSGSGESWERIAPTVPAMPVTSPPPALVRSAAAERPARWCHPAVGCGVEEGCRSGRSGRS